jgi:DNA modification methylase
VNCCVTSPPYFGLRDYGHEGQMGLEPTPDEFVAGMVEVFREVRRVLRDDGTLWLNIGDTYAAHGRMVSDQRPTKDLNTAAAKQKNGPSMGRVEGFGRKQLIGIPWRLAFALQADGWYAQAGHHLVKAQPHARERARPLHQGA